MDFILLVFQNLIFGFLKVKNQILKYEGYMIKKMLFPFFVLALLPFYGQADIQTYDEVVSLGYGCQVAWQLETHGYRKIAYPFDWFHTSFDSLISFICNKGACFLEWDKICVQGAYPGDPIRLHVVDMIYGIHSYHDFTSTPAMGNYLEVKEKYDRRVQRFFELLNSKKKILFVREGFSRNQLEQLDNLLQMLYPHLSYTILGVSDNVEFIQNWKLKRIRNFYLQQNPEDWKGDFSRWKEILSHFCIKHSFNKRPPEEVW